VTSTNLTLVGEVLKLVREPVDIELTASYRPIGVRSFGKGIFHYDSVDGFALSKLRWFKVRPDELVISNIKGWEGAISVSSEAESDCVASSRFLTYQPRDDRADIHYLRYYFLSEAGLKLVRRASPGSTDRNLTLGINAFESLEIPLPPIELQRKIASRLDALRSKASELRTRQSAAARRTTALVATLATRYDLSDAQKTRAGWRRLPLRELMRPSNSEEVIDPDGTYRIAGVYSFGRGLIDRGTIGGLDTKYRSLARLAEDNIIFSRLGAWEGAVAVVSRDFAGSYVSPEYPVFTPDLRVLDPAYFVGIARSPWLWDSIGASTRRSMARRKRIKAEHFLAVEIWLPPITEQQRIASLIRKALSAEKALERSNALALALEPAALNEVFANLG
jgi:type I restriction enzyme, S subunit